MMTYERLAGGAGGLNHRTMAESRQRRAFHSIICQCPTPWAFALSIVTEALTNIVLHAIWCWERTGERTTAVRTALTKCERPHMVRAWQPLLFAATSSFLSGHS